MKKQTTQFAIDSKPGDESRESFASKWQFRLASLGSAIGLGAIVRFPFLCFRYGGGAFLVPYLIFLCVLGIPLLGLEYALGARFQMGVVGALTRMHSRMWVTGAWAVITGLLLMATYNVIMSWCWVFLINSFQTTLPWGTTIESAQAFFLQEVMGQAPGSCATSLECGLGGISWKLVVGLLFQYIVVYFTVFKGTKWVGRIVWFTVLTPIVMVFVLLAYGLTLEGSHDGIYAYIGTVDASHLGNPQAWIDAAGQIFYGLSLAMGAQIAYGSYNKPQKPINGSVYFVSIANSVFSFIAGFSMFSVAGFLINQMDSSFAEQASNVGGFSLSFMTFPAALNLLPSGVSHFFSAFFFLFLLMLGLDSSMGLVEAVTTVLKDHSPYLRERGELTAGILCVFGFITGLPFCFEGGEAAMGILDHYNSTFGFLCVALFECIALWIYDLSQPGPRDFNLIFDSRLEREMSSITGKSLRWLPFFWSFLLKFIAPLIVSTLFVLGLIKESETSNYEGYPTWAIVSFGWLPAVIIPGVIFIIGIWFPFRLPEDEVRALIVPRKDTLAVSEHSEDELV